MRRRNPISIILYLVILALVLWMLFSWFGPVGNDVAYSEVVKLFENEQVKSFVVEDGQIHLKLYSPYKGDKSITTGLADVELFRQEMGPLLQSQMDAGILKSYDFVEEEKLSYYDMILPLLIVGRSE